MTTFLLLPKYYLCLTDISGEAPPVVIKNKKKVVVIDESQKE